MAKRVVFVRQSHINWGTRNNSTTCPVALAMKEAKIPHPIVNDGYFCYGRWLSVLRPLPKEVIHFIVDFDNFEVVYPFSFEVEL